MAGIADGLKGFLRLLVVAGIVIALFLALMIAWWLALVVALAFIAISYFKGLFRRGTNAPVGGPVVIEGEYTVERHGDGPPPPVEDVATREPPREKPGA